MKVVIFGATGFLGKQTLLQTLEAGHQVTVLVRKASALSVEHPQLRIVEGLVLNPKDVESVMNGQDAVIQVLGYNGKGDGKPTTFTTDATRIIVEAMKKFEVKRLIAMSVMGAGNSIAFFPKILSKLIFPVFMRWFVHIIHDKNTMEPIVMNSGLEWTLVRSITIKDEKPKGRVRASLDGQGLKYSVSLQDVAGFLVEQLESRRFINQAPVVSK